MAAATVSISIIRTSTSGRAATCCWRTGVCFGRPFSQLRRAPLTPPQQITFINSLGLTQRAVVVPVGLPGNLLTPPAASGQLFRTYYNLEVSQSVHNCRHNGV